MVEHFIFQSFNWSYLYKIFDKNLLKKIKTNEKNELRIEPWLLS